jgi:hypothetical protein
VGITLQPHPFTFTLYTYVIVGKEQSLEMTISINHVQSPYHKHLQPSRSSNMNGTKGIDDSPRCDYPKNMISIPESMSTTPSWTAPMSVSRHTITNQLKTILLSCDALREDLHRLHAERHESSRQRYQELNRLDRVLVDKLTTLNNLLSRQQQSSLCPTFWEYAQTIRGTFDRQRPSSTTAIAPKDGKRSLPVALSDCSGTSGCRRCIEDVEEDDRAGDINNDDAAAAADDDDDDDDGTTTSEAQSSTPMSSSLSTSSTRILSTKGPPWRATYTCYGWCEAWLLRSLHHAMNWKRQLDRVRIDSNTQIVFLYNEIESIQEDESDIETQYYKWIHQASQKNSTRRKLLQHYLHVQECIIHKLQRWEQQYQRQQH